MTGTDEPVRGRGDRARQQPGPPRGENLPPGLFPALILVGRRVGIPLADIRTALAVLPPGRAPTAEEWQRVDCSSCVTT